VNHRLRRPAFFLVAALLALMAAAIAGSGYVAAQAAPTVTVTKTADTDDGQCDSDCSLREAIGTAEKGSIVTVPAGAYTLDAEIEIDKSLLIAGAGPQRTIVQAAEEPGVAEHRVFIVNTPGNVAITGMTIRHGKGAATVGLRTSGDEGDGGGINVLGGATLALSDVVITANTTFNRGGAVAAVLGTLLIAESTISGNSARYGGGLYAGRDMTVVNSTVSGNSANLTGGGIQLQGVLTMSNSTVSGNHAELDGGGLNNAGTATVVNSTFTENSAAEGGGIFNDLLFKAEFTNTIIANSGSGNDCAGRVDSLGHNLDSDGSCAFSEQGDLSGVDPMLGPLEDNGGSSLSHAPRAGSPAVDAGYDAAAPSADQRHARRPEGDASDIGSVELDAPPSRAPVSDIDAYVIEPGQVLTIDSTSGVLVNDTSQSGAPLTALLAADVSSGKLSLNEDGSFTYAPEPESVTDYFTYRAGDGTSESEATMVMMTTLVEEETIGPVATPEPLTGHGCIAPSDATASTGLGALLLLAFPVGLALRAARPRKRGPKPPPP
jgi:CSLREA domain-containing protein